MHLKKMECAGSFNIINVAKKKKECGRIGSAWTHLDVASHKSRNLSESAKWLEKNNAGLETCVTIRFLT